MIQKIPFPEPAAKIGGRNFWRLRQIREFQATVSGEPAPIPQTDDEIMLNARQVCARFGNISLMTLHRWRNAAEAA